jgi:hypothetical protein
MKLVCHDKELIGVEIHCKRSALSRLKRMNPKRRTCVICPDQISAGIRLSQRLPGRSPHRPAHTPTVQSSNDLGTSVGDWRTKEKLFRAAEPRSRVRKARKALIGLVYPKKETSINKRGNAPTIISSTNGVLRSFSGSRIARRHTNRDI